MTPQPERGSADRWVRVGLAGLLAAAVAWVHWRYVLAHFSNGGDLLDSGWFAWIMASGDPLLANPRAVSDLSYYNYHLSPWLSGLSVTFHALGVDRFAALALHQGAMFGLLAAAAFSMVLAGWRGIGSALLFVAAGLVVVIGDIVLQVASYPHFEIAILSFCALGSALLMRGRAGAAAVAFALACMVREDGGLYAAVFLAAAGRPDRRWLWGAAAAVVVSAAMFGLKAWLFPGFSAFAYNYSGDSWRHLSWDFVAGRLGDLLRNPQALATLGTALVLGAMSWRYLIAPVLLLPLLAAQLVAARVQLGHFTLYYAMPFLVTWLGLLLTAGTRAMAGKLRLVEPVLLVVGALACSGPVLYVLNPPSSFPVLAAAMVRPVVDLPAFAAETAAALPEGACVSLGVAALVPDAVAPGQVVGPEAGLSNCRSVFLFNGDLDYPALRPMVEGYAMGPVIEGWIERYDQRP